MGVRKVGLGILFCASGLFSGLVSAQSACSIDRVALDRGERTSFQICGSNIPRNFELNGLAEAGIEVSYAQWMKRCSPERKERGLYVWLTGSNEAQSTTFTIRDPDSGEVVCDNLALEVGNHVNLGEAVFKPVRHPEGNVWQFTLEAPKGTSFNEACSGGLSFPGSEYWPSLELLDDTEMGSTSAEKKQFGPEEWYSLPQSTTRRKKTSSTSLGCSKKNLTGYVRITGDQYLPAKVVINDLGGERAGQSGIAYVSLPEPRWASAMSDDDAKFVTVNGYRTRYFEKGRGKDTLILVHGGQPDPMSPSAQFWKQNFEALASEFRVIAFDNLGHGYTDGLRRESDYEDYYARAADHLYAFIRELELERVHLVGHSQGGWPVMRVALENPELVQCVVSAGTVLAPFDAESKGLINFAYILSNIMPPSGPTAESLWHERQFMGYTTNNQLWSEQERRAELAQRPEIIAAKRALAVSQVNPGSADFIKLRSETLAKLTEGQLQVPHLIIWGRNDPMADYRLGLEFYEIASNGPERTDLKVFNHAGHNMMIEYPEAFNVEVASFCGAYRAQ